MLSRGYKLSWIVWLGVVVATSVFWVESKRSEGRLQFVRVGHSWEIAARQGKLSIDNDPQIEKEEADRLREESDAQNAYDRAWRGDQGEPYRDPASITLEEQTQIWNRRRKVQAELNRLDAILKSTRSQRQVPMPPHLGIAIPLYLLAVILVIIRAFPVVSHLRKQRRARRGMCYRCGYDLRASAGHCPECGFAGGVPTSEFTLVR